MKSAVFITFAAFLLALMTLFFFQPHPPLRLDDWKKEQIVMGSSKAPVEIILFEDLLCEECQNFTLHILPLIIKEFIDTGLARLIYAPIAILDHPEKAIGTCYCLFRQDPKKTLTFLERFFQDPDNMPPVDAVLENNFEYDRLSFKKCFENFDPEPYLKKNLAAAESLISTDLELPLLFIQGEKIENKSYFEMKRLIQSHLQSSP